MLASRKKRNSWDRRIWKVGGLKGSNGVNGSVMRSASVGADQVFLPAVRCLQDTKRLTLWLPSACCDLRYLIEGY